MKTQFVIFDKTSNTGSPYFVEGEERGTNDLETATKFKTEKQANKFIKDNNFEVWAVVESINI